MRKFLLLLLFFTLTPLTLTLGIALLVHSQKSVLGASTTSKQTPFAYAALPTSENVFEGSATMVDKRTVDLKSFLTIYRSPLAPYAQLLVDKADQYRIDYRLLPAIAMQETTLCKKTLKQAQYNCWGWGIWGKKVTSFSSFDEAIDTITKYFAKKKENGIVTLDAIGSIYNPGNTSHWKENVASFMAEL